MDATNNSRRTSKIWKHFIIRGNYIATCKVCKNDYSYKTSISNLSKHLKNKHSYTNDNGEVDYGNDTTDCSDDDVASIHSTEAKNKQTTSQSTWQYFDILDSDQFVANCKLCDKDIAYDSVSDLRAHAKEHNAVVSDDEDWVEKKPDISDKKRLISPIWQHMQVIDKAGKVAVCLICRKQLSYISSASNLKKHLVRAHKINLKADAMDNTKNMIISTDGQLYEISTSDGEKDPIQTDAVYLDDDSLDDDNFDTVETIETKTPSAKRMKFFDRIHHKKDVSKEVLRNNYKNIDSNKNTSIDTRRSSITNNTSRPDRLQLFGEYIISLLKELPTHVSDQLQSDIIKQIFTAKIALETPYSVPLNTEPVTVTISKSNSYNMPEITVHNTSVASEVEVNDSETKIATVLQNDDETEEAQKLKDVWNYFEQEGTKARCVVCREVLVDSSYDNLKGHLFEQHPKLLLQLVQEQDQDAKSDAGSGNEDNTYTEVVYLEQDTLDTPRSSSKPKITRIYSQQRAKKRTRNNSSSDHPIVKLKKEIETPYKERAEKIEEDSELEAFIKYIRCLLKKLSPDAFSKVQVDILKSIMDAQYSSKITDIKDTSTISGTSILTDIANSSVPNVIRVSEIATENGAIVGNYTVSLAPKGDNLDSSST